MYSKKLIIVSSIIIFFALVIGTAIGIGIGVISEEGCNIDGYGINGELVTSFTGSEYPETSSKILIEELEKSADKEHVKAIIIDIDSFGGSPAAADMIADSLKRINKPTIAVIGDAGLSAAYWAVTGADRIFASPNSHVGGIGVSMSLMQTVEKNKEEGVAYESITSARFKNIGDPNKELTDEERELLQRDVDIIHENFVLAVSKNRELDMSIVESLADGSFVLGGMAFEKGLIDEIGDTFAAKEYLKSVIGEEARVCWY